MMSLKTNENLQKVKERYLDFLPIIGLTFVIILFTIVTKGDILNQRNLRTILNSALPIAMISTGAIFVYAQGTLDLSIGSVLGFANMVGIAVGIWTNNWVLMLLSEIAVCVVFTNFNYFIQRTLGVPAFVTSLCVSYMARGAVQIIISTRSLSLPESLYWLDSWLMKMTVLAIVIIVTTYFFNYTKLGKYNCAIGGNVNAAIQAGVKVGRYGQLAYTFHGIVMGIAAFLYSIHTVGVKSTSGQGFELKVLFALVLGGLPLAGGYGVKAYCGYIGAFTVIFLEYGLQLVGVAASYAQGLVGLLFLLVVVLRYDKDPDGLMN